MKWKTHKQAVVNIIILIGLSFIPQSKADNFTKTLDHCEYCGVLNNHERALLQEFAELLNISADEMYFRLSKYGMPVNEVLQTLYDYLNSIIESIGNDIVNMVLDSTLNNMRINSLSLFTPVNSILQSVINQILERENSVGFRVTEDIFDTIERKLSNRVPCIGFVEDHWDCKCIAYYVDGDVSLPFKKFDLDWVSNSGAELNLQLGNNNLPIRVLGYLKARCAIRIKIPFDGRICVQLIGCGAKYRVTTNLSLRAVFSPQVSQDVDGNYLLQLVIGAPQLNIGQVEFKFLDSFCWILGDIIEPLAQSFVNKYVHDYVNNKLIQKFQNKRITLFKFPSSGNFEGFDWVFHPQPVQVDDMGANVFFTAGVDYSQQPAPCVPTIEDKLPPFSETPQWYENYYYSLGVNLSDLILSDLIRAGYLSGLLCLPNQLVPQNLLSIDFENPSHTLGLPEEILDILKGYRLDFYAVAGRVPKIHFVPPPEGYENNLALEFNDIAVGALLVDKRNPANIFPVLRAQFSATFGAYLDYDPVTKQIRIYLDYLDIRDMFGFFLENKITINLNELEKFLESTVLPMLMKDGFFTVSVEGMDKIDLTQLLPDDFLSCLDTLYYKIGSGCQSYRSGRCYATQPIGNTNFLLGIDHLLSSEHYFTSLFSLFESPSAQAPVISVSEAPADPWNKSYAFVKFSVDDPFYPPEMMKFYWKIDAFPWSRPIQSRRIFIPSLGEGAHKVSVRVVTPDNRTGITSFSFRVDTLAPRLSILTGIPEWTNDTTLTVYAKCPSGNEIPGTLPQFCCKDYQSPSPLYTISIDTNQPLPWRNESSYFSTQLADGEHLVTFYCADDVGNISQKSALVKVDTVSPNLFWVTRPKPLTSEPKVYFSFFSLDNLTPWNQIKFQYRIDDNPWSSYSTKNEVTIYGIPDGSHTVTVKAIDLAGNDEIISSSFTIDTQPPTLTIDIPKEWLGERDALITIEASDNVSQGSELLYSWSLDDKKWTAFTPDNKIYLHSLKDGRHTVRVKVKDVAGNLTEKSASFFVEATPPVVKIVEAPPKVSKFNTVSFRYTASGPVTPGPKFLYSYALTNTTWSEWSAANSVTFNNLQPGQYTFIVKAKNQAGVEGLTSYTFGIETESTLTGGAGCSVYPDNKGNPLLPLLMMLAVFIIRYYGKKFFLYCLIMVFTILFTTGCKKENLVIPSYATPQSDNQPPAALQGLKATPGDSVVYLTWPENKEDDIAGYNLYKSIQKGTGYEKINKDLIRVNNYVDSDVKNNITYFYTMTSVDTAGQESGYSNEVEVIPTPEDNTPPEVVNVYPENGATAVQLTSKIYISFSEPIDHTTLSPYSIILYRNGSVEYTYLYYVSETFTVIIDTQLLPDNNYNVYISGIKDLKGNIMTTPFRSFFGTIDTIPPSPPDILSIEPGDATVLVSYDWENSAPDDIAGFLIYRSTRYYGPYSLLNTSLVREKFYLDTGLINNTEYFYRIKVVDTSGNVSDWSITQSAIPREERIPPYVVSVIPQDNAEDVPQMPQIEVTFSEGVNPETFQEGLRLYMDEFPLITGVNGESECGGATPCILTWKRAYPVSISGTFSYNPFTYTLLYTPLAFLNSCVWYRGEVSDVRDLAGNTVDPKFSWRFRTGDSTSPALIPFDINLKRKRYPGKNELVNGYLPVPLTDHYDIPNGYFNDRERFGIDTPLNGVFLNFNEIIDPQSLEMKLYERRLQSDGTTYLEYLYPSTSGLNKTLSRNLKLPNHWALLVPVLPLPSCGQIGNEFRTGYRAEISAKDACGNLYHESYEFKVSPLISLQWINYSATAYICGCTSYFCGVYNPESLPNQVTFTLEFNQPLDLSTPPVINVKGASDWNSCRASECNLDCNGYVTCGWFGWCYNQNPVYGLYLNVTSQSYNPATRSLTFVVTGFNNISADCLTDDSGITYCYYPFKIVIDAMGACSESTRLIIKSRLETYQ